MANSNTGVAVPVEPAVAGAALDMVLPELMALPQEAILSVNMDASDAASTALASIAAIQKLRPELVLLPNFNVAEMDKLREYALALSVAHGQYLVTARPPAKLERVTAEGSKVREVLLAEARMLVSRGFVAPADLDQLKGANGARNIATDLIALSELLERVLPKLQNKTLTTAADLEKAQRLGEQLLLLVGERDRNPEAVADIKDLRRRAFTKLSLVHEGIRRGVAYVRGDKEDVDELVPPLHPGRTRTKPQASDGDGDTPAGAGASPAAPGGSTKTPTGGTASPAPAPLPAPAPSPNKAATGPFVT